MKKTQFCLNAKFLPVMPSNLLYFGAVNVDHEVATVDIITEL